MHGHWPSEQLSRTSSPIPFLFNSYPYSPLPFSLILFLSSHLFLFSPLFSSSHIGHQRVCYQQSAPPRRASACQLNRLLTSFLSLASPSLVPLCGQQLLQHPPLASLLSALYFLLSHLFPPFPLFFLFLSFLSLSFTFSPPLSLIFSIFSLNISSISYIPTIFSFYLSLSSVTTQEVAEWCRPNDLHVVINCPFFLLLHRFYQSHLLLTHFSTIILSFFINFFSFIYIFYLSFSISL